MLRSSALHWIRYCIFASGLNNSIRNGSSSSVQKVENWKKRKRSISKSSQRCLNRISYRRENAAQELTVITWVCKWRLLWWFLSFFIFFFCLRRKYFHLFLSSKCSFCKFYATKVAGDEFSFENRVKLKMSSNYHLSSSVLSIQFDAKYLLGASKMSISDFIFANFTFETAAAVMSRQLVFFFSNRTIE